MTPLNVHSYLPIEQERKLAVALAPVTSSTHASNGDNEGNTGENNDGSEALAVSEEEFLEAATAGKNQFVLVFSITTHFGKQRIKYNGLDNLGSSHDTLEPLMIVND